MKIKTWAFILSVVGALVLGAALGFGFTGGMNAAGKVLQALRPQTRVVMQAPQANNNNDNSNGSNGSYSWGNGRGSRGFGMMPGGRMPGSGQYSTIPAKPADLPQGFNAGVNIEAEYAVLTSRTAEQVQSAEQAANSGIWTLAQSEGKLDALKQKVTEDVTASLKQMVSDGKLTQAQSDSYHAWVQQYLDTVTQLVSADRAPQATPAPTATGTGA